MDKIYEAKTRKHISKFLASKQFTDEVDGKKYKIIQTKDSEQTTKISIRILRSTLGEKLRKLTPFMIQDQMIDQDGSSEICRQTLTQGKSLKKEEDDFMD